jgi:hypothetical protein
VANLAVVEAVVLLVKEVAVVEGNLTLLSHQPLIWTKSSMPT